MPRSAAFGLPDGTSAVADEIAAALARTPRQLPSHYLYDRLGSSLFEAICHLPWYRIAVTERRLLGRYAAEINALAGSVTAVAELGPGSGEKLLTVLTARRAHDLRVYLIDVSIEALDRASRTLGAMDGLHVSSVRATYEAGLESLNFSDIDGDALVAFLGSNIGNFDRDSADALLRAIRSTLRSGSCLLLGTDLVKPETELLLAYDDPLGVTAAFNRNLLVRINRELGGNFDIDAFAHRAVWNPEASRVEMHLVSLRRQRALVRDADLEVTFDAGDTIWTESSYKYRVEDLTPMLARAGFEVAAQWVEDGFALTLARAI